MNKHGFPKQMRGSLHPQPQLAYSDRRRSLVGDIRNYVRAKPKWSDVPQIDFYAHRVSIDCSPFPSEICDKRTSMSTATTGSDPGLHPIIALYEQVDGKYLEKIVDDPIEELSSQSDESEIKTKKKNKKKKKKEESQPKFKTEMCKNWDLLGRCNYGKKCQFAHGLQELCTKPEVVRNNKYKSKLCKSFHQDFVSINSKLTLQVCYYGARCQFIHESRSVDDMRRTSHPLPSLMLGPVLNSDHSHSRLRSLKQLTTQPWVSMPFQECIRQWVDSSKGPLLKLNSSSSSSE